VGQRLDRGRFLVRLGRRRAVDRLTAERRRGPRL
jgi:hypothetical protein